MNLQPFSVSFRDEGKGIVIISHKLEETLALSDRVTVLRNGKLMMNRNSKDVSVEDLSAYIFGNEKAIDVSSVDSVDRKKINPQNENPQIRKTILQVTQLSVEVPEKPFLRGIDLSVKSGMITGFAGVRDSGLETLELALAGFLAPKQGTIMLNDTQIDGKGPAMFRKAGGAYLSGDRTGTAMAYDLPLWDSLVIHAYCRTDGSKSGIKNRLEKLGFMDKDYLNRWTNSIMKRAGIFRSVKSSGQAFSGGMLQRIVLQRELAEDASLYILSEPVWGLDRNAVEKGIGELKQYAAKGKSILVFSSDLDFLVSVSDEIVVLQNGSVSASFETVDYAETRELKEAIGFAMVGAPRYHGIGFSYDE